MSWVESELEDEVEGGTGHQYMSTLFMGCFTPLMPVSMRAATSSQKEQEQALAHIVSVIAVL